MGLGQIIIQAIQKVIDSPMKPIYKYPLAGLMLGKVRISGEILLG